MMDTDILFRDSRTFKTEFNDTPSTMTSDSAYSTTCEGSDSDTFSPWNFNTGMSMDYEFMLDKFEFDPASDGLCGLDQGWTNSTPTDGNHTICRVKQEPISDIQYELACIKKEFPALEDISTIPLLEEHFSSDSFPIADLPPTLDLPTDLCSFINGEDVSALFQPILETKPSIEPQIKAGRKKIDLKAQRYIVEEDEEEENVDIETISENGNNPVLEAGDLNSLLEQFEATEVSEKIAIKEEKILPNESKSENIDKNRYKNDTKQNKRTGQGAFMDASKQENASTTQQKYVKPKDNVNKPSIKSTSLKTPSSSNRQIIDALPRELIDRIKESGKRKRVAIIDPVPNTISKKRKTQENVSCSQPVVTASPNSNASKLYSIELDHSYCSIAPKSPKSIVKDSGYISAEDDDKAIHSQPIVKNADGKLMISLLKTNTIKSVNEEKNKRKLNIEEYKKRRQGILSTPASSQSNSPLSSNCSSPLPEDERTKRLKHEEKLRKMALELLNTQPKPSVSVKETPSNKAPPTVKTTPPPVDMDVITYVSMGVNTDVTGEDPFAPAEKLEEIKPLLEQASAKINSNSLINSLIENIPNVIKSDLTAKKEPVKKEHGEDKTIIYLPKNRRLPQTADIAIQTSITLIGNNKRRYRHRRDSSSSSYSSDCSYRSSKRSLKSRGYSGSRSSRSNSTDSSSSRSSIRSRSRSITRSPSPQKRRRRKRVYDKEYVQEVEERRVVYVGKLAPKTTKEDLYRRFSKFGPIKTISIHFRNAGYTTLDNYGFVTFANKLDAYKAIEHGNDDPYDIHYDLSFGGRRLFCKTTYSDLDNMRDDFYGPRKSSAGDSFDILLKEMQEKLKKRKA